MARVTPVALTARQQAILRGVVESYVETGQPVGSHTLVERAGLDVSSSTVRSELAELEARGLLTHPHTSAGRVPTEQGYRYYADRLLERLDPQPGGFPLDLSSVHREPARRPAWRGARRVPAPGRGAREAGGAPRGGEPGSRPAAAVRSRRP